MAESPSIRLICAHSTVFEWVINALLRLAMRRWGAEGWGATVRSFPIGVPFVVQLDDVTVRVTGYNVALVDPALAGSLVQGGRIHNTRLADTEFDAKCSFGRVTGLPKE